MVVIVFDVDGVLADSTLTYTACVNYSLNRLGKQTLPAKTILQTVNVRDIPGMLHSWGVDSSEREAFEKYLFSCTSQTIPPLVSQADNILSLLHKKGARLYVLSASKQQEVDSFLREHDIKKYFIDVYSEQRNKSSVLKMIAKQERDKVYFIGDTVSDLLCAREARGASVDVCFIGVLHKQLSGYVSRSMHWSAEEDLLKNMFGSENEKTIRSLSQVFSVIPEVRINK
ncbi:MAG: HAD family hydrolase [Candidatus Woesearchaeota archaeon]